MGCDATLGGEIMSGGMPPKRRVSKKTAKKPVVKKTAKKPVVKKTVKKPIVKKTRTKKAGCGCGL